MDYKLELDDVFELSSGLYIVLDKYKYNGINYCFCNKLIDENTPGKEFKIFKCLKDGIIEEDNENILSEVIKVFSDNLNKKIAIVRASMEEQG